MAETQERAINTLYQEVSAESIESARAASMLSYALTRLEDFILLLDSLERLAAGIEDLTHGFLSPSLISPQELRHSLHSIDVRVHSYGAGLRVLRKRPSYYYGLHHFISARQGNNLVINVHVPLSDLPGNLPVYQVHILPLPVPNANDHATVVTNVPKFLHLFRHIIIIYHLTVLPTSRRQICFTWRHKTRKG